MNCDRRRPPSAPGVCSLLSAAAALLFISPHAAAEPRPLATFVALDPSPCPDEPLLASELRRVGDDALRDRPGLQLQITAPRRGAVTARLVGSDPARESTIPVGRGECRELPTALRMLLRSWLDDHWTRDPDSLLPDRPPRPTPPSERAAPLAEARERAWALVAQGGAFLSFGAGGSASWLAASVERGLTPAWGAAASLAREGSVRQSVLGGSVAAETWTLAARARITVRRDGDARLEVLAGPALRLLHASTRGLPRTLTPVVLDPVLSLSARLQQRLAGSVSVLGGIGLELCGGRDVLGIGDRGASVVIDPVRLNVAVGLAFPID